MAQTEDTSATGSQNDCQLPLGYDGVVRIRAVPHIVLTPQAQPQPALQDADTWEVAVGGAADNLAGLPPCRLEWIIRGSAFGERRRPHPRETCLVPDGKRFKVQEKNGTGSKALTFSAFELGLIGKGRLGYRLEPALTGNTAVEVKPDDARAIPFDLDAGITFDVAPAELTRDWLPDAVEAKVHAKRVGTVMKLTPRYSDTFKKLFAGQVAKLELFPEAPDRDKDATVQLEWEIGNATEEARLLWKIGFTTVRGALGEVLKDHLAVLGGTGPEVPFQYQLTVSRKPPPADKNKKKPPALPGAPIPTDAQPALTVPRPRLKKLEVVLDNKGKLRLQGAFDGFSDSVSLDLIVKPYVRTMEAEDPAIVELDDYFRRALETYVKNASFPLDFRGRQALALCSPDDVNARLMELEDIRVASSRNKLERELLDFKSLPQDYVAALKGLKGLEMFAVVKLGPAVTTRPVPISAVIDYVESEPGDGQGYASFSNGTFVSKVFAEGICTSNTVDLSGRAAELHSPLPIIPPDRQEEFEVFIGTVAGESIGQSEHAWKAVAHTIMNRVARKYETWRDCLTTTEVIKSSGFEAHKKEIYTQAIAYLRSPASAAFASRDRLQRLITAVAPIFMRQAGNGLGVVFFFSPNAQKALAAKEAAEGKPGRPLVPGYVSQGGDKTLVDITKQLLGEAKDDFAFYAFKYPDKFPRLTEEEMAAAYEARKKAKK